MKCEKCGKQLPKNSSKNGIEYFYCRDCKKSYSSKKHEPKHHVFEEYIARFLFKECVKKENEFTKKRWTINQIARLLGHHHRDISKWVNKKVPITTDKKELIDYIRSRENGSDILSVLGLMKSTSISDNLIRITERINAKDEKKINLSHFAEDDYLALINMPIASRMDAIVVLSALLGCKSSEIFGANYNEIFSDNSAIQFPYQINFNNNTIELSKWSRYASGKVYPLSNKMIGIIEWLKSDTQKNMKLLGAEYNTEYKDFLCVQENVDFIRPYLLRNHIQKICDRYSLPFTFYRNNSKGELKICKLMAWFHCMRNSVKQMMLNAGVEYNDVKNIFGFNPLLEKVEPAYNILDKYIVEKTIN